MTTTLEINGKRVQVDDSFRNLSPEEQEATVQEIAQSMGMSQDGPNMAERFLGQAARSVGGVLDAVTAPGQALGAAINERVYREPGHNTPDLQRTQPTGRAVTDALVDAEIASPNEPEGPLEMAGKGAGDALAAFAPILGTLNQMRAGSGMAASLADDLYRSMATKLGLASEVTAGAAFNAAETAAEDAGAGQGVSNLAGLGAATAIGAGTQALGFTPLALAVKGYRAARQALTPMTEAGAREEAAARIEELVGTERMRELAGQINPRDEFGRTAAEQTGDPNMIGLQRAAMAEDPELRARLESRRADTERSILEAVRAQGGDPMDARTFFRKRLSQFKTRLRDSADRALAAGDEAVEGMRPDRTEGDMSSAVVEKLKSELAKWRDEERQLWGSIPDSEVVDVSGIRDAAEELVNSNSKYQSQDVPSVITQFLKENAAEEFDEDDIAGLMARVFGEDGVDGTPKETARDLFGLYSELRRVSRVARSGDTQNRNQARIADGVADAIMEELDKLPAAAEARAYTRALNETFYTGAPGKLLARTAQTVERIPPETALNRTVGRGGEGGAVDARGITNAAPDAQNDVQGYLTGQFVDRIMDPQGKFTPARASAWLRQNQAVLRDNPDLREEFQAALKDRQSAQAFAVRAEARQKLATEGPIQSVANDVPEKAIHTILGAINPAKAAKSIKNAGAKDPSGKALDGVKGAFTDYLTQDARRLPAIVGDPKMEAALREIFTLEELSRIKMLSAAMARFEDAGAPVGEVINSPTNKIIDMVVRIAAAKTATQMHPGGNAGVDLQTAQMASQRAKEWLGRLTNDKARQIIKDAIEDPELMRTLMMSAPGPKLPKKAQSKLAPYLVGAAVAQDEE